VTLTIILVCAAVLLALAPLAVIAQTIARGDALVYGASMVASAVSLRSRDNASSRRGGA
jgi:hypothetical protein